MILQCSIRFPLQRETGRVRPDPDAGDSGLPVRGLLRHTAVPALLRRVRQARRGQGQGALAPTRVSAVCEFELCPAAIGSVIGRESCVMYSKL